MGFDTSYHVVDLELIHKRVIPFLAGDGDIDDLVEKGTRIAEVRFEANSWGLGVLALQHDEFDRRREDQPKKASDAKQQASPNAWVDRFDSNVHVWGRPFFIVANSPGEVSRDIDRYLNTTPPEVKAIAAEMIARLDPSLAGKVTPDAEGEFSAENVANGLRWKLEFLRDCVVARKSGKKQVTLPDGSKADPAELLKSEVLLPVLEFAANFRPGWMSRGYTWPTTLLTEAGVDVEPYFEPFSQALEPLHKVVPELAEDERSTIEQNYQVGGYVRPQNVPAFRRLVETSRDKVITHYTNEQWDDGARVDLQKLIETLTDAESRGMGFAEATEVYSGPMGIMN